MSLATLPRGAHIGLAVLVALGFFVFLAIGITGTDFGGASDNHAEDMDALVDALFDDHVLALEVLGILLTAALIGAMVIARPLGTVDDATNYPNKRAGAGMAEVQHISDVDRNLGAAGFSPSPLDDPVDGGEEE